MASANILVVDDDPGILRLLQYSLTREGFEVVTAANGVEGLRIAQQMAPDLVVLDVMLPGLDGFEVCRRLRSGPGTHEIPILMLSAKGQETDIDTGLKVGADKYLTKPINRAELLNAVQALLSHHQEVPISPAQVIAFIGSRGGIGTSTVVINIAVLLAQDGRHPILMDLCPSSMSMSAFTSQAPERGLADLLTAPGGSLSRQDLESAMVRHGSGVRVLAGGQGLKGSEVYQGHVHKLVQGLRSFSDYVLIDVPSSASELAGFTLGQCDFVCLLTMPGYESSNRIDSAVTFLALSGVDRTRIGIISIDGPEYSFDGGSSQSSKFKGFPVVGSIPYDAEACSHAKRRGVPVIIDKPLSQVSHALDCLAKRLTRLDNPYTKDGQCR